MKGGGGEGQNISCAADDVVMGIVSIMCLSSMQITPTPKDKTRPKAKAKKKKKKEEKEQKNNGRAGDQKKQ
jgi:hypothetical protein